jgi:Na+-transporting NADH:ubiquinone oxidoreductase subunit B
MPLKKYFLTQKVMIRVSLSLVPLVLFAVYLFGWRAFFITLAVLVFGIATEAHFTVREGKPVTSAVIVTCLIYSLSLPPTIPFWIAIIGIITGVTFGKMVFGGFGQNIYNPAMVGRCFIYIAFPKQMTGSWIEPMWGGASGFAAWDGSVDAVTRATPLMHIKEEILPSLYSLFIGNCSGSMGETSALLIIAAGIFLVYKKAASWRLVVSCLAGGLVAGTVMIIWGNGPPIPYIFLSGAFLFGCVFVVTEPISGPKTQPGQIIYGFIVGSLTILLREFSNFSEGFMFSILLMNAFAPLIDFWVNQAKQKKQAAHE